MLNVVVPARAVLVSRLPAGGIIHALAARAKRGSS
jgi:hypothetical protein